MKDPTTVEPAELDWFGYGEYLRYSRLFKHLDGHFPNVGVQRLSHTLPGNPFATWPGFCLLLVTFEDPL